MYCNKHSKVYRILYIVIVTTALKSMFAKSVSFVEIINKEVSSIALRFCNIIIVYKPIKLMKIYICIVIVFYCLSGYSSEKSAHL